MYVVTKKEIARLRGTTEGPCVSIFVPARGMRSGGEKNSLRLRRLLKGAEELVPFVNDKDKNINQVLNHLRILSKHTTFLTPKNDGIVLFLSPEIFRYYRPSRYYPESLAVSDHFHVLLHTPSET